MILFGPPVRQQCHLQMILSCQRDQYSCLDTLYTTIHQLFLILKVEIHGSANLLHTNGSKSTQRFSMGLEDLILANFVSQLDKRN